MGTLRQSFQIPVHNTTLPIGPNTGRIKLAISPYWIAWIDQFRATQGVFEIITRIVHELANAVVEGDTPKIAFLSRRLSSELIDSGTSPRALFKRAKYIFLHGEEESFRDR